MSKKHRDSKKYLKRKKSNNKTKMMDFPKEMFLHTGVLKEVVPMSIPLISSIILDADYTEGSYIVPSKYVSEIKRNHKGKKVIIISVFDYLETLFGKTGLTPVKVHLFVGTYEGLTLPDGCHGYFNKKRKLDKNTQHQFTFGKYVKRLSNGRFLFKNNIQQFDVEFSVEDMENYLIKNKVSSLVLEPTSNGFLCVEATFMDDPSKFRKELLDYSGYLIEPSISFIRENEDISRSKMVIATTHKILSE